MKISTKQLCLTAVFMALTFIVTRFIQIPIPLGYFNVGNSVILLSCLLISSPYGIFVGSLGSALADLTSYPEYTIPTLVIKALMPIVFYLIYKTGKKKPLAAILACAISTLIPLFGYTLTGSFFAGTLVAGFAQFPGLFLEYVANLVIFSILFKPILKLKSQI